MNFSSPWTELFAFVFAFIFSSLPFDGRHLWEYQKPCHHQTQGDNVRKPSYQGLILFFQWFINFNFSLLAKWTFYFQQEREFKANCLFGMLGWKDSYLISILFTIILFFFSFLLSIFCLWSLASFLNLPTCSLSQLCCVLVIISPICKCLFELASLSL